jgi:hypothetical protein
VILSFHRDVDQFFTLLGYSAASSSNPDFLDFLTLEDGTETSFRNVGKELPLDAA